MKHYTYIHKRADDGRVFYVGLGSTKDRYRRTDGRNRYWQRVVAKHGFTAEIVCRWGTREEAASHEILLIECFLDMGYELTNMTAGGEGMLNPSDETRAQLSEHTSRQWQDPEYRAKHSDRTKARMADLEYRARLSELAAQQWSDSKARAKNSEQARQQWENPEYRFLKVEQARRQWADPLARARKSEQMRQYWANPEPRAKKSEHIKGRVWVNNGQINKRVQPDQIPEGFVRGFIKAAKLTPVPQ